MGLTSSIYIQNYRSKFFPICFIFFQIFRKSSKKYSSENRKNLSCYHPKDLEGRCHHPGGFHFFSKIKFRHSISRFKWKLSQLEPCSQRESTFHARAHLFESQPRKRKVHINKVSSICQSILTRSVSSKLVHSVVQSPVYNINSRNFALKPTVKSGKAEEVASPGSQEARFQWVDLSA